MNASGVVQALDRNAVSVYYPIGLAVVLLHQQIRVMDGPHTISVR